MTSMPQPDILTLIQSRLEDLADQIKHLLHEGNLDGATLLFQEGLELASCADDQVTFMYLEDLTQV